MKKVCKRMTAFVLAVAVVCMMIVPCFAETYVKDTVTGCFNGMDYGDSCDVYTDGKTAKVKICTFYQNGKKSSGKVTVKYKSDAGTVKTATVSSGGTLTLPKGSTHYLIWIKRYSKSYRDKDFYVSIDFKSHCWHYSMPW